MTYALAPLSGGSSGPGDVVVRTALDAAPVLRGLDQIDRKFKDIERQAGSLGKVRGSTAMFAADLKRAAEAGELGAMSMSDLAGQSGKLMGLARTGFMGAAAFGTLKIAIDKLRDSSVEFHDSTQPLVDQWNQTWEKTGNVAGKIFRASMDYHPAAVLGSVTGMTGTFGEVGAYSDQYDARRANAASAAQMAAFMEREKAAKEERDKKAKDAAEKAAKAAEDAAEAAAREEESRRRIVEDMERAANEARAMAAAGEDEKGVWREILAINRERAELDKLTATMSYDDARSREMIERFNAAAEARIAAARAEAARESASKAKAAAEEYRLNVASLEVTKLRAQGDEKAADAAEALLDAERQIAEIRTAQGLTEQQRADLIERARAVADEQVRAIARRTDSTIKDSAFGGGAPAAVFGAGTSDRATVLAQTFGALGVGSAQRDAVALLRDANKALAGIGRSLEDVKRGVAGGVAGTFGR